MSTQQLSEGQRRRLYSTFVYIDDLLDEVERRLAPGSAPRAFPRYVGDATPVQAKVVADYAARVRTTMLTALRRHQMAPEVPKISAVWAARSSLRSAGIAATELTPRHMRGYGALSEELARDLNLISAALNDLFESMGSHLARGPGRELHERVHRIHAPGDCQELLQELERVITAHGLIELRGALEVLVEQLESDALEVAVFGRVNCGKSSLLNFILGQPLLPVGVTPITSVPTRIMHGSRPQGTVWFVDAQTETFEPGRLAEFASEHQNPGNARHVTRLQFALPHPVLQGVTLVDTPGLGSLASAGAAETIAYLPRCDVGIVLIDAASTLTPDDAKLTDALARAGAHVIVALTKADLLSSNDLAAAESYVQHELFSATGLHLPVRSVSVKASNAALTARWIDSVLMPCLNDRRRLRYVSLSRKIEGLRADAIAALDRRLAPAPTPDEADQHVDAARVALGDALLALDRLRAERGAAFPDPGAATEKIIAQAAHNAAVIWRAEFTPTFDATAILVASLEGAATAAASTVQQRVATARAALANALDATARQVPRIQIDAEELARPVALPTLDAQAIAPSAVFARPALLPPARPVLAVYLRRQFERMGLRASISAALERYGQALDAWRTRTLEALRRDFVARSDRITARIESACGGTSPTDTTALRADLQRLHGFDDAVTHPEPALAAL